MEVLQWLSPLISFLSQSSWRAASKGDMLLHAACYDSAFCDKKKHELEN
jgi:hypothetical protein